jgi:hypothetical protein
MRASSSLVASASPGTPSKTQDLLHQPEDWCWTTETHLPLFPQQLRDVPLTQWLCATIGQATADPLEVWERGREIDTPLYHWRLALREE